MSSSVYVASLAIQGLPVFHFAAATTEYGHIPDQFLVDQEELTDKGVDFARWRDRGWRYRPFEMATVEDDVSYSAGRQRLVAYLSAPSKLATLVYTAGGVQKIFRRVKVLGVGPHAADQQRSILHGCSLYGPSASSPSLAVLLATWTLQLTQPASQ